MAIDSFDDDDSLFNSDDDVGVSSNTTLQQSKPAVKKSVKPNTTTGSIDFDEDLISDDDVPIGKPAVKAGTKSMVSTAGVAEPSLKGFATGRAAGTQQRQQTGQPSTSQVSGLSGDSFFLSSETIPDIKPAQSTFKPQPPEPATTSNLTAGYSLSSSSLQESPIATPRTTYSPSPSPSPPPAQAATRSAPPQPAAAPIPAAAPAASRAVPAPAPAAPRAAPAASARAAPPPAAAPSASADGPTAADLAREFLQEQQQQQAAAKGQSAAAAADAGGAAAAPRPILEAVNLDLPSPLQLFLQYDTSRNGSITMDEFGLMLFDLDGLQGVPKKERDAYINEEFTQADQNHDEVISIDEFYYYYYAELCFKFPVLRTGVNPGADLYNIFIKYCSQGKPTRNDEMASNQFAKLCKDCKLINDRTMKKSDVDIVYCRAKAETEVLESFQKRRGREYTTSKMYYEQFLYALLKIAEKRRSGFQEVVGRILGGVSAVPTPSQADFLVLKNTGEPVQLAEWLERPRGLPRVPRVANDNVERMRKEAELAQSLKLPTGSSSTLKLGDASSSQGPGTANGRYAGVADSADSAAGGGGAAAQAATAPPAVPREHRQHHHHHSASEQSKQGGGSGQGFEGDLPDYSANLMSAEQRKKWGFDSIGSAESLALPRTGREALADPAALLAVRHLDPDHMMMALKRTFEKYNMWQFGANKSAMDKIRFAKVLRDAKLISESGNLPISGADKIFFRVVPPSRAHIHFVEFVETLRHVATCHRCSLNEIMEKIVLVNAPLTDVA